MLEILAQHISLLLFVAQRPSTYSQLAEHWEILGRLEVGLEKVACWSTKANKSGVNISETRKDRGKVTMEGVGLGLIVLAISFQDFQLMLS